MRLASYEYFSESRISRREPERDVTVVKWEIDLSLGSHFECKATQDCNKQLLVVEPVNFSLAKAEMQSFGNRSASGFYINDDIKSTLPSKELLSQILTAACPEILLDQPTKLFYL